MLNKIKNFVFSKQKTTGFLFFLFLLSFFLSDLGFAQDLLPTFEQNIQHDQRPTDLEYALMSNTAYIKGIEKGAVLDESALSDWKVHDVRVGDHDYKGVVFENSNTHQLVVAHKGTSPTSIGNLLEDVSGIVRNENSPQKTEVFILTRDMIKYAKENGYYLSFTGHSLGAFLAELSVFYCHDQNYPMVNAVTFESPGSQESIEMLQSNLEGQKIDLNKLDIITYVASPNKINTLNHHVGTMYQLETDLGDRRKRDKLNPAWYTLNTHSMDKIVDYFINGIENNYPLAISDWPVSSVTSLSDLTKSKHTSQQRKYFEHATFDKESKCYHVIISDEDDKSLFDLTYNSHYKSQDYDNRTAMPLRHFSQEMQSFLHVFDRSKIKLIRNYDDVHKLIKQLKQINIPAKIINYLISYHLVEDKAGNFVLHLESEVVGEVYQFRDELSGYLQDGDNLKAVENVITENIKDRCDLSELSNVPYPVIYSQDRKELDDVRTLIDRCSKNMCPIYIVGFAGSGKTQLAIKYAHNYEDNYHHTRFFDASDSQKLLNSFESLARSLGHEDLERCLDLQGDKFEGCVISIVKRCLKELPDTSRFLWVFDDAKKSEEIKKYIPEEQGIKGVVLITTKKKGMFANHQEVIDLNKGLTDGESCWLLRKVIQENIGNSDVDNVCSNEEIQKIAIDFWHNLPLPISYTGAIIGKLESCEQYINTHNSYPESIDSLVLDLNYKLQSDAIQEHISLLDKLDLEVTGFLVFVKTPFLKDLVIVYIGANDIYREILNFVPIDYDDKLKRYNDEINIIDKIRTSEKIKNFELINSDETGQTLSFPHELFIDEMHKFLLKRDEEDPGVYKRLFDQATEFLYQKFTGNFWDDKVWDNKEAVLLPSVERVVNDFIVRVYESEGDKDKVVGARRLLPLNDSQFILLHRLAKYYIENKPAAAIDLFDSLLEEITKNRGEKIPWWNLYRKYCSSKKKIDDYSSEYLSNPINQALIMRDLAVTCCQLHYNGNGDIDLDRAEELAKTAYKIFGKELGKENPRTFGAYLILMHIRINLKEDLAAEKVQNNQVNMVGFIGGSEPTIDAAIALTGLSYRSEDFKKLREELGLPTKKLKFGSYKSYYDLIRDKYDDRISRDEL